MADGYEKNAWLQALKDERIYFSYPIDLDFSMLAAFPESYQHPHLNARGPRGGEDAVQQKKLVTLKTGGNPELFDDSFDEQFQWYPYLFLSRRKPETHLAALSRISEDDLADQAPPELKALIGHIKTVPRLEDDDE